jgi:hypothetical protein
LLLSAKAGRLIFLSVAVVPFAAGFSCAVAKLLKAAIARAVIQKFIFIVVIFKLF